MAPRLRWISALALACAVALPAQETGKPATPAPLKVGVIDLQKAMDNYPAAVQDQKRLQEMSKQFDAQLGERTKAIEELKAQRSSGIYKPGSMELLQIELRINIALQEREGLAKLLSEQFDREYQKWELSFYDDMEFAVTAVAKERGVDIVLRADDYEPDDKDPRAVKQRYDMLRKRAVWFASAQVDLTPHLIKYLQVTDVRAERQKVAEASAKKTGSDKTGSDKTDGGQSQGK